MAKKLTLGILVVSVIIGLILLFFKNIDMERYMTYVKAITLLYAPLVASIGLNSGVEKVVNKNSEKENQK